MQGQDQSLVPMLEKHWAESERPRPGGEVGESAVYTVNVSLAVGEPAPQARCCREDDRRHLRHSFSKCPLGLQWVRDWVWTPSGLVTSVEVGVKASGPSFPGDDLGSPSLWNGNCPGSGSL